MTVDPSVSRRMSRTRRRDTKAELVVRRMLHARGHRYRVDHQPIASIRRTGDIVFTRARVAILIDGCFWHGCPDHFVIPRTRTDWWLDKIEANQRRDEETTRLWTEGGWTVLRFWEHEDPADVVEHIERSLRSRAQATAALGRESDRT